ncbi:hypothetical protein RQP46_005761 [Phenoliferia psychrophenolica]
MNYNSSILLATAAHAEYGSLSIFANPSFQVEDFVKDDGHPKFIWPTCAQVEADPKDDTDYVFLETAESRRDWDAWVGFLNPPMIDAIQKTSSTYMEYFNKARGVMDDEDLRSGSESGLVQSTYDIGCRLLTASHAFREAGETILLAAKELSDAEDDAILRLALEKALEVEVEVMRMGAEVDMDPPVLEEETKVEFEMDRIILDSVLEVEIQAMEMRAEAAAEALYPYSNVGSAYYGGSALGVGQRRRSNRFMK